MTVTMDMIKGLRQSTGAGIMECKEALKESDGDIEGAAEYLRKKGITKMAKKADRNTKEGAVGAIIDGSTASIVEVKCETDFVARNEKFKELVASLASHIVSSSKADSEEDFLAQPFASDTSKTVKEVLAAKILEIGENITIGRRTRIEKEQPGILATYIHGAGNIGVLLELGADSDDTAGKEEFTGLSRDLTMQIAAMNPIALKPEDIPQEIIDKEKEIFAAQARESGKPENIIEKIVEGSIRKFMAEACLPKQTFVKDNKKSVEAVIKETASQIGGKIEIRRFVRYQLGE